MQVYFLCEGTSVNIIYILELLKYLIKFGVLVKTTSCGYCYRNTYAWTCVDLCAHKYKLLHILIPY